MKRRGYWFDGGSEIVTIRPNVQLVVGALLLATGCTVNPPPPPQPLATPAEVADGAAPTATATPLPTATMAPTPTPPPLPSPAPTPSELLVELDEAILTRLLNEDLAGQWQVQTTFGTATVRNLLVQIRDDRVVVTGDAQTGFFSLPLAVTTTVTVQSGRPVVRVLEASVGGVLLPEGARQQIEITLQGALDRAVARERFELRTLDLSGGMLTARGRRVAPPTARPGG